MRNFEERKAEIFRRSEERINKRRRTQKHILTIVPLCLLLVACAATLLPQMQTKGRNNATGELDNVMGETMPLPESAGDKRVISAVEIERISNDSTHQYYGQQRYMLSENAEKLGQFYYSMESALEPNRGDEPHNEQENLSDSSGELDGNELPLGGGEVLLPGDEPLLSDYKITFIIADGTKVVYTLNGYTLTKEPAEKGITLTQSQYAFFLETLKALTMPKEETQ